MDEASQRLMQVYEAVVKLRLTPAAATQRYGMSLQVFHNYVKKLSDRGYIRRKEHLPPNARWDDEYPWEVAGRALTYQKMPTDARLRVTRPVRSQADLGVPPIRVVRWGDWVVQAVPILRLDGSTGRGGRSNDKVPNLRAVVISDASGSAEPPTPDDGVCFLASVRDRWHESDTRLQFPLEEDSVGMTQVIAVALGVTAVLDVSKEPPTEGE